MVHPDPRFLPKTHPLALEAAQYAALLALEGLVYGVAHLNQIRRLYLRPRCRGISQGDVEFYVRGAVKQYRLATIGLAILQKFGID